jgi:hypothetical protein
MNNNSQSNNPNNDISGKFFSKDFHYLIIDPPHFLKSVLFRGSK